MEHDSPAVYTFIGRLMVDLKVKNPSLTKLYFFSDGAAAHFKNAKNFASLSLFKRDYGVSAEWHFFGSGHGKGACDGLGGTVKRLHRNALKQRDPNNAISTPKLLYDWAVQTIPGINSYFVEKTEVEADKVKLKSRYESSIPITGTRSFHSFIPVGPGKLKVSTLSTPTSTLSSSIVTIVPISYEPVSLLDLVDGQYLAVYYEGGWSIACIESMDISVDSADDPSVQCINVRFMNPQGPAASYYWPKKKKERAISAGEIIQCISAPISRTRSGRNFSIDGKTLESVEKAYEEYTLLNMA